MSDTTRRKSSSVCVVWTAILRRKRNAPPVNQNAEDTSTWYGQLCHVKEILPEEFSHYKLAVLLNVEIISQTSFTRLMSIRHTSQTCLMMENLIPYWRCWQLSATVKGFWLIRRLEELASLLSVSGTPINYWGFASGTWGCVQLLWLIFHHMFSMCLFFCVWSCADCLSIFFICFCFLVSTL